MQSSLKNLTTPQLKAALRRHGFTIDADNPPSRSALELMCREHGIDAGAAVASDHEATRARVAAELSRAAASDDAEELRTAIQRAQTARGACTPAELSCAQQRLRQLEDEAAAAELSAVRERQKEQLEGTLGSGDVAALEQALKAVDADESLAELVAAAERERARLSTVAAAKAAAAALEEAMHEEAGPWKLDIEIQRASAVGASPELIAAATERCSILRLRAAGEADAHSSTDTDTSLATSAPTPPAAPTPAVPALPLPGLNAEDTPPPTSEPREPVSARQLEVNTEGPPHLSPDQGMDLPNLERLIGYGSTVTAEAQSSSTTSPLSRHRSFERKRAAQQPKAPHPACHTPWPHRSQSLTSPAHLLPHTSPPPIPGGVGHAATAVLRP